MQFGIQCEQGIAHTYTKESSKYNDITYRIMNKTELDHRWSEIWHLINKLIRHLQESPIFYPGEEFTQDVYRDFFMDECVNVFIAEKEGKLIGIIQTNHDGNDIITTHCNCSNIGDIYVEENYRGQGIAQSLLSLANDYEHKKGTDYLWVEHGTANPEGRTFWNKVYQTYVYTMIRDIEQQ